MPHVLHDTVLEFIAAPEAEHFEPLALRIFQHQFEYIELYRRVCEQRGSTPATVRGWRDIPLVPVSAFKQRQLSCDVPERIFLSSGTTQGTDQRSRHAMPDLRLYRAASVAGLRRFLFPDVAQMRILSLVPRSIDWPESSLAQMVSWAIEVFGDESSRCCATPGVFQFEPFVEGLRQSEGDGAPLCILTTTAGLVSFFDYCRERDLLFRLPHSSRLMDTGGAKGAPRVLSRNGLLQAIWSTFAIPGYYVVNEYGMSELSSQYYDNVLIDRCAGRFSHRAKVGPAWLRTRFLDPQTLKDVAEGESGLLCHIDLANVGSALAVLTEDIGRRTAYGFDVIGRATGSELRGCSLALSHFVA